MSIGLLVERGPALGQALAGPDTLEIDDGI